jgi:hypothetical protein
LVFARAEDTTAEPGSVVLPVPAGPISTLKRRAASSASAAAFSWRARSSLSRSSTMVLRISSPAMAKRSSW